jgi:hypothetical protein
MEWNMDSFWPKQHSPLMAVLAALLFMLCSATAMAGDITIAWDPNSETDLAGYKIYYGMASGIYGTPIVIGTQTTYTLTGLPAGTYYVVVTAFNTSGLESSYSNEVHTTLGSTPGTTKCDANSDDVSNVLDLQILINAILGIQAMPAGKGDLNNDGRIDVLDLQILGNVILGLRSCPS